LARDLAIPLSWQVQPWVFIPERSHSLFQSKFTVPDISGMAGTMPQPRITYLESAAPWNYCTWDRKSDELAVEA
jgi:hypothetical protein